MNKKGAGEMTIGTLVTIVLAVLILVLLALGFGMGWQNLWEKLGAVTSSNVDTVKLSCDTACATQSEYDYCCKVREIKLEEGESILGTCYKTGMIKSSGCDLSCSEEGCSDFICKGDKITEFTDSEKTGCPKGTTEEKNKRLKSDLTPLSKEILCCKSSA